MHLFFDTVWKLHIGEIPEKPKYRNFEKVGRITLHDTKKYNEAIAAIKQNALTVGNPILCPQNMSAVEPGKFYEWIGGYETKEIDLLENGYIVGVETVAILTLPEEKKNTMENMKKALEVARTLPCACSDCGMRETESAKKILEFAESLSGSVAAPKEEERQATEYMKHQKLYDEIVRLDNGMDFLLAVNSGISRMKELEEALKELLEGLENLNSYAPDFPEYPNSLSQFDLGLSKASKDAKAIIEKARKLISK